MAKLKRSNVLRRVLLGFVVGAVLLFGVMKFWNNHKTPDLQSLLQNLPKEISQNIIQAADSHQRNDVDLLGKFEELLEEIKKNQADQAKQLEKQRRVLERKIQKLKQVNEAATLRERLAFTFEYDTSKRFPAFVWQVTPCEVNEKETKNAKNAKKIPSFEEGSDLQIWGEKNPGFVVENLNDQIMDALIQHYYSTIPEVIAAYNMLPSVILKVDFFKYLILLARGGISADIDTTPLQPIPNWIPESISPKSVGLIIGIEHDSESPEWKNNFVRRLQFGTWIIQCKPGHPIIREVIAQITEETLNREKEKNLHVNLRNELNIMSWTGSGIFTDVIFSYFNNYLRSGVSKKITWKHFHGLVEPKLLSDVLVFPKFSFNAPSKSEIGNSDIYKSIYLVSHKAQKPWKSIKKLEK